MNIACADLGDTFETIKWNLIYMNIVKKLLAGTATLLCASTVFASPINVGGVVFDPDQTFDFGNALDDFAFSGTLIETAANNVGDLVTGFGIVTRVNSSVDNQASFCPSCELTFVFTMNLASITPTGGDDADFTFDNLVVNMFVDSAQNFVGGDESTASDGDLFLGLIGNGVLSGSGTDIATGSDTGTGSALLDVIGGLAAANFDTNTQLNGADFVFSSSFQPIASQPGLLFGDVQVTGDSVDTIPEPASLLLMGIGLLGLAGRKKLAS